MSVQDKKPTAPTGVGVDGLVGRSTADTPSPDESVAAGRDHDPGQARAEATEGEAPPASDRGAEASPARAVERLEQELAAKSAEAQQHYDRLLRERAELENFKKRVQRERNEAVQFAAEQLIRDLLPLIDNLERAIEHAESGGNGQPLVEGVRLVWKSALDMLERHGVSRVEATGQSFDPSVHEAIAQVQDADREPNQVVQQFQAGYLLHQRLLRPAKVSVSARPNVENGEDDD